MTFKHFPHTNIWGRNFEKMTFAITSLGEEKANLRVFRTFVRFVLVWICRFPLGVWEGLRFVIVALPGLFSYLFFFQHDDDDDGDGDDGDDDDDDDDDLVLYVPFNIM